MRIAGHMSNRVAHRFAYWSQKLRLMTVALAAIAHVSVLFVLWLFRRLWSMRCYFRARAVSAGAVTSRLASPVPVQSADWERIVALKRPAIAPGAVDRWPFFLDCNPESLRHKLGSSWQSVLVTNGESRDFAISYLSRSRVSMPSTDLIDEIFIKKPGPIRYYCWSMPLGHFDGELDFPKRIGKRPFIPASSSIWMGQGGNLTSLHYDHWHGFLSQVYGRKKVVLFSPLESPNVYNRSPFSAIAVKARLPADCRTAPPEQYPRFYRARGFEATLNPGDLLYIPPFWWHQVECLDPCVSVALRYAPTSTELLRANYLPLALREARQKIDAFRSASGAEENTKS